MDRRAQREVLTCARPLAVVEGSPGAMEAASREATTPALKLKRVARSWVYLSQPYGLRCLRHGAVIEPPARSSYEYVHSSRG